MRSSLGRGFPCSVLLLAGILAPAPAGAVRLIRHFPVPKWCSIISGHDTPFDLQTPYLFTVPAGQSKVTLVFKADNRLLAFDDWNNQRLDDVVVLERDNLPASTEDVCFNDLSDGSEAVPPQAFPSVSVPAVFRDSFVGGARPEWGAVPAGDAAGNAPAPVFWQPSTAGVPVEATLLHEDFEDGLGQGWTPSPPGPANLWRPGAADCVSLYGARHLAFSRPDPLCSYDVDTQGPVGGTYTSPPFDLRGTLETRISFEHRWDTTGQPQEWVVETSENDGVTWVLAREIPFPSTFGGLFFEEIQTTSQSQHFRFRFRFGSSTIGAGAREGWYIDEIRVVTSRDGSLALGRSTRVGGQLVDSGEVVARLNLTGLVGEREYALMARWNSLGGTEEAVPPPDLTAYLTVDHFFDSTPPSNPTLSSSTHVPGVWSSVGQVGVQWSGAADNVGGTGVAGYSTVFDAAATTTPDTTIETPHASDPHSFTSATLTDGGTYHFHVRTCDHALNCAAAAHLGPFRIDRTPPTPVAGLTSSSHTVGVSSLDRTIDITWTGATDASSGVDGYAFTFDNAATWACDQTKDAEETATGTTSPTLAVGSWYFHICTRDNAGNWSTVVNLGPFPLVADTSPPTNPTLGSSTHTVGVWSSQNVVTATWSGASDPGGLAGYSVLFDTAAATTPNTSVDVPQASDPHSFSSTPLADGGSYYFHLRACDVAQNCSAADHLGPFRIDQTPPGTATGITSPSHALGVPSPDNTIDVTWQPAIDLSSGVDGYSFAFDGSPTWTCDQALDVQETATAATSAALAPGSWYFHICTRDNAGNWSAVASAGPYVVSGLRFYTLTPCRLVDTRGPLGALGGPPLAAGAERTFPAGSSSTCVIPSTAKALVVNATAVSPSASGNLRFYAGGSAAPQVTALNYSAGQTRANNAIVPLNAAREFTVKCVQTSGTTHFILDVAGYFE